MINSSKKYIFLIIILLCLCPRFGKTQEGLFLPFLDDFSSYLGQADSNKWEGDNCFVNRGYQFLPPTVGVVTLDVIDKYGKLYPSAGVYTFNADTLCSKSIRLDSLNGPMARPLSVADSVYLSFFIQPGGGAGNMWERIGSAPSSKDSITLEFYDSQSDTWQQVWSMHGTNCENIYNQDSAYYKYVIIKIDQDKYFNNNFKFRFLTYSTLDNNPSYDYISNCDQWNLDYIYLNYNRSLEDKYFRDIAFVNPAGSFLKDYQAMPYKHFQAQDMAEQTNMTIINLFNEALSSHYHYVVTDQDDNIIAQYDGGFENIHPYSTTKQYQVSNNHALPPIEFAFPSMQENTTFTITHIVTEGVGNDNIRHNDTVRFFQHFEDYFAYDDASAENGFGLEPIKGSNLAIEYSLAQEDTLYAVDIYFNNTYENANIKPFYICLWDAENGLPNQKIYQTEKLTPTQDSLNKFARYILDEPQILPQGKFFVSIEVKNADYLNIGFDQNNDASMHTFEKISNQWQQSFLKGAVMIRPYFGYKSVGITDINPKNEDITFYPNPANDFIQIQCKDINPFVEIFDLYGKRLISQEGKIINISALQNGIYILRINNISKKLIISK